MATCLFYIFEEILATQKAKKQTTEMVVCFLVLLRELESRTP